MLAAPGIGVPGRSGFEGCLVSLTSKTLPPVPSRHHVDRTRELCAVHGRAPAARNPGELVRAADRRAPPARRSARRHEMATMGDVSRRAPVGNRARGLFRERRRLEGESVGELYWYLDATPTHSYARALYKYPQAYYAFDNRWLRGDPSGPAPPPPERKRGRNREWRHLFNSEVLSMPDKWEYPGTRHGTSRFTAFRLRSWTPIERFPAFEARAVVHRESTGVRRTHGHRAGRCPCPCPIALRSPGRAWRSRSFPERPRVDRLSASTAWRALRLVRSRPSWPRPRVASFLPAP